MHDVFLEQLYRWLEPLVDWLLASSRMEWLVGIVEGFHMADALMLAAVLVLGLARATRASRPGAACRVWSAWSTR